MGHLHDELEPVGSGEPVVEMLRPVSFEMLSDNLDGVEHPEQLTRIGWRKAPHPVNEGVANEAEKASGKGVARNRSEIG
jgi:hypothetical protein